MRARSVNGAFQVGHETVRLCVMGWENWAPTLDELDKMKALVAQTMEEGAFGLSTGLMYTPGNYAETEEVIELAKVAEAAAEVALVRVPGHYLQGEPLSAPSDHDGGVGFLEGLRLAINVFELVVPALVGGGLLGPEALADLHRFPHHPEPGRVRGPVHAPVCALVLAPAGAEAEL